MMPYSNRLNFNDRYPEALSPGPQSQKQLAYRVGTNLPRSNHKGPNHGSHRGRHSTNNHDSTSLRNTPYPSPPNCVRFQQQSHNAIPNPALTRQPFVNKQCPACGKVGHTMQTCDMLAMAISLKGYMSNQVSAKMMTNIEKDWLSKHRERLQKIDACTPRQVLWAFADANNLSTVADIDNQMDWTAWEYDSLTNLTTDTPTTDTEVTNSK